MVIITAALVVFGLVSVYGASSALMQRGRADRLVARPGPGDGRRGGRAPPHHRLALRPRAAAPLAWPLMLATLVAAGHPAAAVHPRHRAPHQRLAPLARARRLDPGLGGRQARRRRLDRDAVREEGEGADAPQQGAAAGPDRRGAVGAAGPGRARPLDRGGDRLAGDDRAVRRRRTDRALHPARGRRVPAGLGPDPARAVPPAQDDRVPRSRAPTGSPAATRSTSR